MKDWWKSGDPWVWLTAASVTVSIVVVAGLLLLIAMRGLGYFWPKAVLEADYKDQEGNLIHVIGEIYSEETIPISLLRNAGYPIETLSNKSEERLTRYLIKTGNRELFNLDFRWILEPTLSNRQYPHDLIVIERREWGNFYGYLQAVKENGQIVSQGNQAWRELQQRLQYAFTLHEEIRQIEKNDIGNINYQLEQLRLFQRRLELNAKLDATKLAEIAHRKTELAKEYEQLGQQLAILNEKIRRDSLIAKVMDGREVEIPLAKVVRVYQPNAMTFWEKMAFYGMKGWEFLTDEPREANTEGGIFPAIFGTVMMVFIMSFIVTPFGVVAAVYLREYAKQGILTRTIRIAVNNLAGVPSIVYGVFGLGFFVYFIGANIDQWFFPEALPAPTFGSGGILWASLTLAILTVPVVIVSTEEGLSRIPSSIREGSLALGATKAETLWRTVLPMASPAIMTGLILAIARAAGEVAPLMLVGVVKLAPSLVADLNYPFIHLERKFMHLGFHIHDVGFQSPNVEAARPLVYATALLLVAVIVILNLTAIWIRNHLREKYKALETS
jgi:phosphate transport system permease protein